MPFSIDGVAKLVNLWVTEIAFTITRGVLVARLTVAVPASPIQASCLSCPQLVECLTVLAPSCPRDRSSLSNGALRHQVAASAISAAFVCLCAGLLIGGPARAADAEADAEQSSDAAISFFHDVKPIFRQACFGCHQAGERQGDYLMTDFASLLAGGETGTPAIRPGKPDASYLVEQITPIDGHAAMPQQPQPPLSDAQIETIRQWIAQGAHDDSPAEAVRYDAAHPPVYLNAPTVTSIDVSHDGRLIAAAAHHEVVLIDARSGQRVRRLVGLSPRINTVRFSPDSKRLAVAAGTPAESGELQVWDVASGDLQLSIPIGSDTLSGARWSPDGSQIAVGSVNIVRAVDSQTGEEVLLQGAHEDWVLDTVYTVDGEHLISVARDMTCKLTEVATQRFIDNVTSITPGALSGGINSIDRHPQRDEILVGGADGVAKVYRVFRETARVIGDDANLVRALPAIPGRIFSVSISPDGGRLAAAATIDGRSEIRVWKYDFGGAMPEQIKALASKRVNQLSAKEKAQLDEYHRAAATELWSHQIDSAAIYAIRFAPDGLLVAAGSDGVLRRFEPDGQQAASWDIVELADPEQTPGGDGRFDAAAWMANASARSDQEDEPTIDPQRVVALEVNPESITLDHPLAYAQIVVTAHLEDGSSIDASRRCDVVLPELVTADSRLLVRPLAEGRGQITIALGQHSRRIELAVGDLDHDAVDFIGDVNPVLSRLGCNQGTCHGAQAGKNGFKLSLRGYDPIFDIRALTDDHAARRINPAAPDDSLMLRKPLGLAPHQGGTLMTAGDPNHSILRRWIADGSELDMSAPRVTEIELAPLDPVIQQIGSQQQVRVVAHYSDGSSRDVTRHAFVSSGDTEIATIDEAAMLTALRRGEAPILARYQGAYAATTLTVMGPRDGFQWQQPQSWSQIDQLVAAKWQRMKIEPSELASDEEFLRRVYLDLTGLPPSSDQVRSFLDDATATRKKRAAVIDSLLASEAFVEYWTNKWADLLQVNRKFLGAEGSKQFRDWIRAAVAENRPYDQFVREILTASGSNKANPPASYFKLLRDPEEVMENTTHLFLGIRFNCNKCHDHPFERWTQDQYYETAAYFARTGLRKAPESGDQKIGGTAVDGAKPLYEEVFDQDEGEILHERTGQQVEPAFPYAVPHQPPQSQTRRQQLAAWLTAAENPYFARSYVNRLWAYLMGTGLIEPIDDIRAGNPPTNPELLDHLTESFIASDFDVRQVMRAICNSRVYQLSVVPNRWNEDDTLNYARASARRLPAEVLFDAIHLVTGSASEIPGVPKGTRAAALPDVGLGTEDGFLQNLGQPVRESACECERSSELQLGPVMALVSGPTVGRAIADNENVLGRLVESLPDDADLVEELYLRILARYPSEAELSALADYRQAIRQDHQALTQALAERQAWWDEEFAKREAQREQALAEAEQQLAETTQQLRPKVEQLQAARQKRIAQAEATLEETRNARREHWTNRSLDPSGPQWFPLVPGQIKATTGANFRFLEDRSILASGNADKGYYELTFETSLAQITGLRLEALTDTALKSNGPGLADNGNFVVTELQVSVADAEAPDQPTAVKLARAVADFSQSGFAPQQAINGNAGDQRGWAVSGSTGQPHWMVIQAAEPIPAGPGKRITIRIHQVHNAANHRLGRFRISATTDTADELPLGLAEPLAAILSTPPAARSEDDTSFLHRYVDSVDGEIREANEALADARAPLPKMPEIEAIETRIERLKIVTPLDPALARLREDLQQSKQQLNNERLTAAEDLTWALINSPAFLFNR